MKRMRWMRLICLLGMMLFCVGPMVMASNENTSLLHVGDRFSAEPHLVMEGEVTGDLVATGQIVSVPGNVGGDLLVVSTELHTNGSISGNLRSVSTVLELQGHVERNISSYASRVHFTEIATVNGNVYLLADTAYLAGSVRGNLTVFAQKLELAGHFEGDVTLRGSTNKSPLMLLLHPGTVIEGTLRYPEGTVVLRNRDAAGAATNGTDGAAGGDGGSVNGTDGAGGSVDGTAASAGTDASAAEKLLPAPVVGAEEVVPVSEKQEKGWMKWTGLKWAIRQILSALLLYLTALVLFRLYPGFFAYPARFLRSRPKSVIGSGLAFFGILAAGGLLLLIAGILAALLFSPMIVVAMVLLILVVFVFSQLLSVVPVALWLGEQLQRGRGSIPGALATGMGVLTAIRLLLRILGSVSFLEPVASIVAVVGGFLIWIVGTGALLQGIRLHHEKAAIAIADGGQEGANPNLFKL